MTIRAIVLVPLLPGLLFAPARAGAQVGWPVSIEANLGAGVGGTDGEYRDDGSGIAGDVLIGARVRSVGAGAIAVAVSASTQGKLMRTADCILSPSGGCVPWFPQFHIISALAGWESGNGTVRLLTGPSLIRSDESTIGWHGRLELAVPLAWRVSLIGSARAALVPDYSGDSFQLFALGAGFRLR